MEQKVDFAIEAKSDSGCFILKVIGELDISTAPRLNDKLMELLNSRRPDCIIDLSETNYLDSSAFHVLIKCHRQVLKQGGKMALAGLQPSVERIFKIAHLTELFSIFDTVEDARESFVSA